MAEFSSPHKRNIVFFNWSVQVCHCHCLYWTSSAVWLKRVMNWAARSTTTSSLRNSTETKQTEKTSFTVCLLLQSHWYLPQSVVFHFAIFVVSHRGIYLHERFISASDHCQSSTFLAAFKEQWKRKWSQVGSMHHGANQQSWTLDKIGERHMVDLHFS